MPVFRNRSDTIRVWRPDGCPYAEACIDGISLGNIALAVEEAAKRFAREFGRTVKLKNAIIEVTFSSSSINAYITELPFDLIDTHE